MFMPSSLVFFVILIFSVLIVISSPSWFGAWVGLEVNLMSFIPLMLNRRNLFSVESCLKYFLVQAFSSLMLLLSLLYDMSSFSFLGVSLSYAGVGMVCALLIKMGAAPFHYWFPAVAGGINWFHNFLLMTIQKLGPLILLTYLVSFGWELISVVMVSTFVGSIGGLNQSSLRKLMAFSSINHLGWLLVSTFFGVKYLFIYFLIYTLTNGILVYVLNWMNFYFLSQVFYYSPNNLFIMLIFMNWLSFGGLPPFIGFMPKWVILEMLVDSGYLFLSFFMVMMSLVSLFYYMRAYYVVLTQSNMINLLFKFNDLNVWSFVLLSFSCIMSLLFVPIFVVFI